MMMPSSSRKVILFDLDDTLYKEIDFVKSGYSAVADLLRKSHTIPTDVENQMLMWREQGRNVFGELIKQYAPDYSIDSCLITYRTHKPAIHLSGETIRLLNALFAKHCVLGIITDGRSTTQRNKIEALGLQRWISSENILISEEFGHEKPAVENFQYFENRFPGAEFTYTGDNPKKDFITPNRLGWRTICVLDKGQNIHSQDYNLPDEYLPQIRIESISQVLLYI